MENTAGGRAGNTAGVQGSPALGVGLYTILSSPILCGIYYNYGGVEGINSVGDDRGVGCLNKGWVRKE